MKKKMRSKWLGFLSLLSFNALRYIETGSKLDLIWIIWLIWIVYFFVGDSW